MDTSYIVIGTGQLLLAGCLMLINLGMSLYLKLQLEKSLLIATLRMTTQLLLIGYLLHWVFALDNLVWILGLALAMTLIASSSAVGRTRRRYPRILWNSFASIFCASMFVTLIGISGIVRVDPWYNPQYLFPLLGMVLGNTLNGISLALDRFLEEITARRYRVETLLALGATRWEAAHEVIKEAARTGMIPILNSMMVMGIVSLPGMMTGQILAGADPVDAVHYQIVIVFMIASASALGIMGVLLLAYRNVLNRRHQLCVECVRRVDN